MMPNVSLVREAIVVISKKTGGWLLPKREEIITQSVKMNLSSTPSETFCNELDFRNSVKSKAFCLFLQNQIWWSKLSNCSQVFYEKATLMNFIGKHLCRSLFLINFHAYWLKKNSCTGVFLWVLPDISEHFFGKTPLGDCFC